MRPDEIADRLSRKKRRFVLAASARRPKSYATIRRHSRGGDGTGLRALFTEVRCARRRFTRLFVLSPLGAEVKARLEEKG